MGQYYLPLLIKGNSKKVFDNHVILKDGSTDWNGLKLMEHSWSENLVCGAVVNALYHNKQRVCWMGDYANENDFEQVNCDNRELKEKLYNIVWNDRANGKHLQKTREEDCVHLKELIIVNHTKKVYINCDEYLKHNKDEGWCVHPLPILTCSASHSGGAYYGPNKHLCGTWFYDEIEVVDVGEIPANYEEVLPVFLDR